MARAELMRTLQSLLRERLGVGGDGVPFTDETGLLGAGIGLDSFEVLQLVGALEEHFDLTIGDDELQPDHFRTVGTLASFLETRVVGAR